MSDPLERPWKDLSNGITHALKHLLQKWKMKFSSRLVTLYKLCIRVVKRTALGKRSRFFLATFSTSVSPGSPLTRRIASVLRIHLRSVEVEIESDRCFPVSVIVTSGIEQGVPRMNQSVRVTYKGYWKVGIGVYGFRRSGASRGSPER